MGDGRKTQRARKTQIEKKPPTEINTNPQPLPFIRNPTAAANHIPRTTILVVILILAIGRSYTPLPSLQVQRLDLLRDVARRLRGVDSARVLLQRVVQAVEGVVDGFLGERRKRRRVCIVRIIFVFIPVSSFVVVVVGVRRTPCVRWREGTGQLESLRGYEVSFVREYCWWWHFSFFSFLFVFSLFAAPVGLASYGGDDYVDVLGRRLDREKFNWFLAIYYSKC